MPVALLVEPAVGFIEGAKKMWDYPDGERIVTDKELEKLTDREIAMLISRNESDSCTAEERKYYRKGAKSALQLFLSEKRAEEIMAEFDKMYE